MLLIQWLFMIPLILSSLIAISASSPIYIWASLEINTVVFIPMMITSLKPESTRSAMKYFFVQAFASLIFLISPLVQIPFSPFLITAMLMKLGASPFHNWFPSVMSSLPWMSALILSTWQKLAPLAILMENIMNQTILGILAALNALVGGLGGLAQSEVRPLLAFSSIGHMGWLFYAIGFSHLVTFIYFMSYFLHLVLLMSVLSQTNIFSPKDLVSLTPRSSQTKFIIPLLLLSLGGLPPLLGFIPKFLVMNLATSSMILPVILILGSYMNIYYYMTLMWSSFMSNPQDTSLPSPSLTSASLSTLIYTTLLLMIMYGLNMYFQP